MKKIKFVLEGFECLRCSHKWIPDKKKTRIGKYSRSDGLPAQCPKCSSPYWLTPRDERYKKVSETQKKRKR